MREVCLPTAGRGGAESSRCRSQQRCEPLTPQMDTLRLGREEALGSVGMGSVGSEGLREEPCNSGVHRELVITGCPPS